MKKGCMIVSGNDITKGKRQELFGIVSGGAGSQKPEEYQRRMIIENTGHSCTKTTIRINLRTNQLVSLIHPNLQDDGFDYSEDFDGIQDAAGKKIYINMKCIVGRGGAQTRSLREVYWFISGQLRVLHDTKDIIFANILDGDEAHRSMSKFHYILSLPENESVRGRIYVGSLHGYIEWFNAMQ